MSIPWFIMIVARLPCVEGVPEDVLFWQGVFCLQKPMSLRNNVRGSSRDFMSGRAVSHTQSQLDDYANQCNPNNEEYVAMMIGSRGI